MFRTSSLLLLVLASHAPAAEPEVRNVSPRGLQIGGTTTITIDGDGLSPNPRLHLPFPAKVTPKGKPTDKQIVFDVTLADDVVAGYHHLRLANDSGSSTPFVIAIDRLPQKPFAPSVESLPVAMHGVAAGSKPMETTFQAKAGQKVMIEVEAQRLGGKLRPVLHLYGPRKLQVAWSWPQPHLQGDTRLEATLPEDGAYKVALHDAEYAAAASNFRLRIGEWGHVDHVFPPLVSSDIKQVELIGSETLTVPVAPSPARWLPLNWPKPGVWSGARPYVETSRRTELLEKPSEKQELPAGAVAVSGKLSAPFEEDRYRIPVTPGSKVKLEVFAERLGSPIDVALVVRNDAGAEVAKAEDGPGTLDPVLDYTVPANVNAIVVGVVDSQGRGSPKAIYRLAIDPAKAGPVAGDFDLTTTTARATLVGENRILIPIMAERRGYSGPIELKATNLPAGVKVEGLTIPADSDGTLVTLSANGPLDLSVVNWEGKSGDGQVRPVVQKNHPMERLQPWLATEFALMAVAKGPEFAIAWKDAAKDGNLVPSRKQPLPFTIKGGDKTNAVRISLLVTQGPRLTNNQPDPNKTLRLEKAIEQPATTAAGEAVMLVPGELGADVFDVALKAELMAADKKTVLATAFTDARRLPVKLPVEIKVDAAKVEAKAGTAEVAGQIIRLDGFTGDVTLVATGLPTGGRIEPTVVKAADKTFKTKVVLPATTPPGEVKGIKLTGTMVPDPKVPQQRVRSNEVELTVAIPPAKK